jgi:CDP-6-deoxy-D-xylo-4-hexulose-3-dehydrase
MDSTSKIKSLIENEMIENKIKLAQERKYFYPLAEPTYGVDEVLEAIDSMVNFKTSMWEKVRMFEDEFGSKYGGHAVMVNSGSSADLLIAFALLQKSGGSLSPGDEILVPAVTWPTHLWSLVMAGFKVRLIDIDLTTLNFDLVNLESQITPLTKGIFIVHLLGNTGNLGGLIKLCKDRNLILLEDCCEALGTKYENRFVGTFGLASSFSFFFSHHLVTMEGGMILTQSEEFARRCRLLRAHGWTRNIYNSSSSNEVSIQDKYRFINWGFNVRPTELQAGFGIEQLKKIENFHQARKFNAEYLAERIKKYHRYILTVTPREETQPSYFAFPIVLQNGADFVLKELTDFLEENGVETRPVVAGNLARQPAMSNFPEISYDDLSNSDYVHNNGFYIGIHPEIDEAKIAKVANVIDRFFVIRGGK